MAVTKLDGTAKGCLMAATLPSVTNSLWLKASSTPSYTGTCSKVEPASTLRFPC